MKRVANDKWRWLGHIARQAGVKWTNYILKWGPRPHKRNIERPSRRWVDDIREKTDYRLHKIELGGRKRKRHIFSSGQLDAEEEDYLSSLNIYIPSAVSNDDYSILFDALAVFLLSF
ncbi:hypothetical protein Trydic_g7223 [Trypoxylus dichotomus]